MRNVSYIPYSLDLSHPADRRRIKIWIDNCAHSINLSEDHVKSGDVLILSSGASLRYWSTHHKGPVVIDLVDGYLSAGTRFIENFARNFLRASLGKSSFRSVTFTNELKRAISKCSAVIVSCPEQKKEIASINSNVICILDDHTEIKNEISEPCNLDGEEFVILWEGLGYTLKHLFQVADQIKEFMHGKRVKLLVVTSSKFYRWSRRIGKVDTRKLLKKHFGEVLDNLEFIEWSIENLKMAAKRAHVGVIPLDLRDELAVSKPENKLLSFWTLCVPTLCSPVPSYVRVLSAVDSEHYLVQEAKWKESLDNIFEMYRYDSRVFKLHQEKWRKYLEQIHTRKILIEKWDEVLQPLMQ